MKKSKKTLLWKLEGADLPATSYVFGTMHVRDKRAFNYLDLVKEKISECAVFAPEFDLAEAKSAAAMAKPSFVLPYDTSLAQLLKPKVYQKLAKLLQKHVGLNITLFDDNMPLLLANLLSESILANNMAVSLDETLWQYAVEESKKVVGVESYQAQLGFLQKIALKDQAKSLTWVVKNYKAYRKEIIKTTHLYEQSELQKLYKIAKKSLHGNRKILLYDRNKDMADHIALLVREAATVCAIGAAHLAGGKGVLRLLKQQGIRIKPVPLMQH